MKFKEREELGAANVTVWGSKWWDSMLQGTPDGTTMISSQVYW